jgi:hypothetical protein
MVGRSKFEQPVLIYDNKCSPCWKQAKIARRLSRGRIRLLGHYELTDDLKKIKETVFPAGYDPTTMSWLINDNGAYGGRAWILPLIKEVIRGLLFGPANNLTENADKNKNIEENNMALACSGYMGWFQRVSTFLRNTKRFSFSVE